MVFFLESIFKFLYYSVLDIMWNYVVWILGDNCGFDIKLYVVWVYCRDW